MSSARPCSALAETTTLNVIVDHTALLVAFGGLPVKNTAVMPGTTAHRTAIRRPGTGLRGGHVSVSPLRDDIAAIAGPPDDRCRGLRRCLAPMWRHARAGIRAGRESLADRAFLGRYCTGQRFERYCWAWMMKFPRHPNGPRRAVRARRRRRLRIWPPGGLSTGF